MFLAVVKFLAILPNLLTVAALGADKIKRDPSRRSERESAASPFYLFILLVFLILPT